MLVEAKNTQRAVGKKRFALYWRAICSIIPTLSLLLSFDISWIFEHSAHSAHRAQNILQYLLHLHVHLLRITYLLISYVA